MSDSENSKQNEAQNTADNASSNADKARSSLSNADIQAKRKKYYIAAAIGALILIIFKLYIMFVTPNSITDYMGSEIGSLHTGINILIVLIPVAFIYRAAKISTTPEQKK